MAGLDIKSIVATCEVKSLYASAPSVEAGHKVDGYSKLVHTTSSNEEYGSPVSMDPIYLMTPDGILHVKINNEHYLPEITINSFSTKSTGYA